MTGVVGFHRVHDDLALCQVSLGKVAFRRFTESIGVESGVSDLIGVAAQNIANAFVRAANRLSITVPAEGVERVDARRLSRAHHPPQVKAIAQVAAGDQAEHAEEAQEKTKVAEQNRKLRLLIENFEGLTEEALAADHELLKQATRAVKNMTGAEDVIFRAKPLAEYPRDDSGYLIEGTRWASVLEVVGIGPSGNLLCLSRRPDAFHPSQVEWCSLLRDFLDKTMENSLLNAMGPK